MAPSGLPLHCNICPKRPSFSDVSHLLTHIASKGHLSHYYKVKVQSNTNPTAKDQIDIYDAWYSNWAVEELMTERMQHKDKRRSLGKTKASNVTSAGPKTAPAKNSTLDPQLTGPHDPSGTLVNVFDNLDPQSQNGSASGSNAHVHSRARRPEMHWWSTTKPASYKAIQLDFSSPPMLPMMADFDGLQDTTLDTYGTCSPAFDIDETSEELVSEAAKLKGVLWPGMDVFDSATQEMRRKRNQKKDVSVVEQLQQNSQDVEPNEMIFFPFGDLRKERKISGRADLSSSPEGFFRPSPPKRRPSGRIALGGKSVNNSEPTGELTPGFGKGKSKENLENAKPKQGVKKRKRKLDVYRDEVLVGHPTGLETLTSEFRPPGQNGTSHDVMLAQQEQQRERQYLGPLAPPPVPQFTQPFMSFQHPQMEDHYMAYQSYYGPPQCHIYGPVHCDLGSLFASHMQPSFGTQNGTSIFHTEQRTQHEDVEESMTLSDE